MKRLFLSLGLSVAILLSAAFAQTMQKKAAVKEEATTTLSFNTNVKKVSPLAKFKHKKANPNFSAQKSHSQVHYMACYKSPRVTGKATVKLINNVDWGDESGCQVLLDAKHEIVSYYDEDEWGLDQTRIEELYKDITASIPQNAKPEIGLSSVMPGDSDSTLVDPGTYDVLVVYPTTEDEEFFLYLAGLDAGMFDDIEFAADYTYVFQTVDDGWGDDVILIPPVAVSLEDIELPLGHCNLTEAEVTFVITNEGSQSLNRCEVYYFVASTLEEDEDIEYDTVKEMVTIPEGVAYGKSYKYTFNQKISIDKDTMFLVRGGIYPLEGEIETTDNENVNIFVRKPAVDVPHEFDIAENEVVFSLDKWVTGYVDEDYTIMGMGSYEMGCPAITSCINMKAGQMYRLSFDGVYGFSFFGMEIPATYGIKFGKVGDDIDNWETVVFEEDIYNDEFERANFTVTPEENGQYAFCFYEDIDSYGGGIVLANIAVTEVLDKDVQLNVFSGFPSMIPEEHANRTYVANYDLVNWGAQEVEKVTLQVKLNGTEIATKEIALGKSGMVKRGTIELPVTGLTAGTDAGFTATVVFADDEDLDNNSKSCTLKVTDDVMAYDFVTEEMYENYGIGSSYGSIGCGVPFSISHTDTLTGVIFGWSEAEEDMEIGIAIHKWNAATETLGDMLYMTETRRGMTAGARIYKVPSLLLESGDYIISALQLGSINYGLLCDATKEGALYVTTVTPAVKQQGLGTPMIRAQFGHDGKPMAKDIFVSQITQPKSTGRFAANQEIKATVINQAYEAAKAPIYLMVNGKVLGNRMVELDVYGRTEVSFVADLSAPSTEYVLTVFSALEGDEDPINDTCTKTVHTLAPVNPYVMDFEDCEDYAISGEFVPAWTSVDLSGAYYAYGLNVDYPYYQEVVGFMAAPNSWIGTANGDRFGIVFGVGNEDDEPVKSNAWLISPKLKLTAANAKLSFMVKSATDAYDLEKYNVMVSVTDNNPENFVQVGETAEAPSEWTPVTVDLAEYAGKDVHIAIQCVSYDAFAFMIDDIVIGNVANEDVARLETRLSVYPNPAKEMITIHAQDAVINQVAVFNVAGMMVYQSNGLNTSEYRYSVKGLNAGIYFARVATEQGTAVMKFVVR